MSVKQLRGAARRKSLNINNLEKKLDNKKPPHRYAARGLIKQKYNLFTPQLIHFQLLPYQGHLEHDF